MQNKWKVITANLLAALLIALPLAAEMPQIEAEMPQDSGSLGSQAREEQELFAIDENLETLEQLYRLSKESPELLTEAETQLIQTELDAAIPSIDKEGDEAARAAWGGNSLYLNSVHYSSGFADGGETYLLKLDDETWWTIAVHDAMKIRAWDVADPLIIVQNTNHGRPYPFCIINALRDESIEVTPHTIPSQLTAKGHCVSNVRRSYGTVRLQNGATFKISGADQYKLKSWSRDHFIVIGVNHNDGWFFEYYPNILINGVTKDVVRANFIGWTKE